MTVGSLSSSSSSQASHNTASTDAAQISDGSGNKANKPFKSTLGKLAKGFKGTLAKSLGFQKTPKPAPFVPKFDEIWFKPSTNKPSQPVSSPVGHLHTQAKQAQPAPKSLSQMSTAELDQRKAYLGVKLEKAKEAYKHACRLASSPGFPADKVNSTITGARQELSKVKAQFSSETKKIDREIASRQTVVSSGNPQLHRSNSSDSDSSYHDGAIIDLNYDPSKYFSPASAPTGYSRRTPAQGEAALQAQSRREPEGMVYGRARSPSPSSASTPNTPSRSSQLGRNTENPVQRGYSVLDTGPLKVKSAPPKQAHIDQLRAAVAEFGVAKSEFADDTFLKGFINNILADDPKWLAVLGNEFSSPLDGSGKLSSESLHYTLDTLKRALD